MMIFKLRNKGIFLLILLNWISPFILFCQNLSIEGFASIPFDLSSRTAQVRDKNNLPCALIKIVCYDEITGIQGNVVKIEEHGNEYWVYLTTGTKYIKVLTRHHAPLDFKINKYLETGVESQSTYQVSLKSDLPPEVLYGSSNPLAPVPMANENDPLLPRWWNIHENGLYVGISLPTLDGEMAKISAITNAIYSFVHATGCSLSNMTEMELREEKELIRDVCRGLKKDFAISISQEYYNSKGEYFVLCAIKRDVKSSNTMTIDRIFNNLNSEGSLSVNLTVKANINRFPFESTMQYEVSWSANSQKYNMNCNGKEFMHNKNIEVNDNISEFILSGDIGLTQLRLLTTIPFLTDTILATSTSSFVSDESYSSKILIKGTGQSIPLNVQLSEYNVNGLVFCIHERFPDIKSKLNDDNYTISQKTGLSEKYNRVYLDTEGNETAIEFSGFSEDKLFEVAKNIAILRAFAMVSEAAGMNPANKSIGKDSDNKMDNVAVSSLLSSAKVKIYPLYYLDPDERVECKEKKYRKEWLDNNKRYQNFASVLIPIETMNINNHEKQESDENNQNRVL